MKKRVSKNVKRRLTIIIGPISIGIFCFTLITSLSYAYRINNLNQTKKNLEKKLVTLKDDADSMSNEITKLKDHEYIAKYARENYYYTKNGEYVLKIVKEKNKTKKKEKSPLYNYAPYASIPIILILLILLIRKKKK